VHVAAVEHGEPALSRADDGPWAALASRTGGVRWTARADRNKALTADMKRVYEEWARPLRIDALTIDGGAYHVRPGGLAESEGLSRLEIVPGAVRTVQVSGKLWSVPIRKTLKPSAQENRRWAALASGSELQWAFSRSEIAHLGRAGRAVTRETSYLAIEPGVRPSNAGFDYTVTNDREARVPAVRMAKAMLGGGHVFDPDAYLAAVLSDAFEDCGNGTEQVDVDVETTGAEIVDVVSIAVDSASDGTLQRCLEDATWAVELPSQFEGFGRRRFSLHVNW
jgi:hypothetical protein